MTAAEQVAADLASVLRHLFRDEDRRYGLDEHDRARLACHVAETQFTHPEHVATVMGWVRWGLHWTAQYRALTADETCVLAAALRVAELAEMFRLLACLADALAAEDWPEARQQWLQLGPFHAVLIGARPDLEYLTVLLQDLTTQPAIH
jgi:hypothetical protein